MGRMVCKNCGHDGKASKILKNSNGDLVYHRHREKHSEVLYYCRKCKKIKEED